MPSIRVRSTPVMRWSSRPKSNCGAWLPAAPSWPRFRWKRGRGVLRGLRRLGPLVGEALQVPFQRLIAFGNPLG
jgi:hypothetical protein